MWKQPFDVLADFESDPEKKTALGETQEGDFEKWLPLLDTLRTRFLMPDDELKADMELYRARSAQTGVEG